MLSPIEPGGSYQAPLVAELTDCLCGWYIIWCFRKFVAHTLMAMQVYPTHIHAVERMIIQICLPDGPDTAPDALQCYPGCNCPSRCEHPSLTTVSCLATWYFFSDLLYKFPKPIPDVSPSHNAYTNITVNSRSFDYPVPDYAEVDFGFNALNVRELGVRISFVHSLSLDSPWLTRSP